MFLARLDIARLLRGSMLLTGRMEPDGPAAPALPTGGPSPITLAASVNGDTYHLRAHANPGRLVAFIKEARGR